MKTRWAATMACVACAAWMASGAVLAQPQKQKVYASMVVTGTIEIGPDGSVSGYVLDKAEKLPPAALATLTRNIPRWKFEPVMRDGKAVKAKSYMSVRLVAKPTDQGGYSIGVGGAQFGKSEKGMDVTYVRDKHHIPVYPQDAIIHHVTGTVYLVMEVGRDAKAHRAEVEQVDLFSKGSASMMKKGREELAQSSLDWAKRTTFILPTKGPEAHNNRWLVRIPITYVINNDQLRKPRHAYGEYGQWQPYIPGPRQYVPWLGDKVAIGSSADAIPGDGGLYPVKQSLHLLTPIGNGS